jgi:hypothetical protein
MRSNKIVLAAAIVLSAFPASAATNHHLGLKSSGRPVRRLLEENRL